MTDEIEALLEVDSSRKVLSISYNNLVYKVEEEIGLLGKTEFWPIFHIHEGKSQVHKNVFIL